MNFWMVIFIVVLFVNTLQSLFLSCFILLMSVISLCINVLNMGESWLTFILALTYVGGVLVLFIYMCSLSSNVKIESDSSFRLFIVLMLFFMFLLFSNFNMKSQMKLSSFFIYNLYSKFDLGIAIFVAIYLTMGLLVSMHLVEKYAGPLKQKF